MNQRSSASSMITDRPVAITMIFLAAVVFGFLSISRLPVALMPELTYPTLTVRTEYPGAAPEEVENDISRPVEEQLGIIAGLKKISSISRAGVSDVVLEFAWDADISDATQDVLEKLDQVFLPDEAKRPLILHYDPSLDPVLELSLSGEGRRFEGEGGLRRLRRIAELQIKKDLEPIKGVAAVRVRGGLEEEIHIELDEETLRRTGIPIQRVIDRLAQENINVAGGTLKEGRTEYLVRTLNEFENLQQIEATIVAQIEGRDVRIRDLGRVRMSNKEREILTRTDSRDSVQIEVYKEGDANIVALAKRVRAALGEFTPPTDAEKEADPETEQGEAAVAGNRGPPGRGSSGLIEQLYKSEGAWLNLVADRSLFIESSIREVRNTAIIGGILAVIVLYFFLLNVRHTVIVGLSIPVSLLITFAPLNLMGVSLNIMSLGGLALGIGMLVDSSIVVLESIHRCREEGDQDSAAAIRGTSEVRGAVIASTLTSIAVFFPMVFVEGIAGQAFGDLGRAVVASLLASAGVALFLIPMLASLRWKSTERGGISKATFWPPASWIACRNAFRGYWTASRPYRGPSGWKRWPLMPILVLLVWPLQLLVAPIYWVVRLVIGFVLEFVGKLALLLALGVSWLLRGAAIVVGFVFRYLLFIPNWVVAKSLSSLQAIYRPVLRGALAQPWMVVLLVAGSMWGTWVVARSLGSELLPEVHQGEFTVEVTLPVGTPIEETDRIVAPIEEAILAEKEHIETLLLTVGYDSAQSQRSDEGEHTARFKVLLEPEGRDATVEQAVISRLRERFEGVPDLEARVVRPVLFSSKTPIEVEIHGYDLGQLREYADQAAALMAKMPQLADVETTLRRGAPEVQVIYDRDQLTRYGLNIREVAERVRNKIKGFEATRFNMKDRRIPIVVQLSLDDRQTVNHVEDLVINPGGDRPIRLSAVADVKLGEGPSEVRRIDSRRVAVIRASIDQGSLSTATARIENTLQRDVDWPNNVSFLISGQNEEWNNSQRSLWIALALSVFLVYVIMAAQFESLLHPFVIMLTVPLAFVGTVAALKLLGLTLSVVVFLGMIMLAGIVVNNAIVLVDYINTLRGRGEALEAAIVQAGQVRLRPILMTTTTTVLGLLPMAVGLGDGAEIRRPMAIAVISGLITSTALTLVVIPSIYFLLERIKAAILGRSTVPRSIDAGVPATARMR